MRALLLATLVAACGPAADDYGYCETDAECDGSVCARSGECLAADKIRSVRAEWTIDGAAASEASCAGRESLQIDFFGRNENDAFGYAPVPCAAGVFTVDKLPTRFQRAELGAVGGLTVPGSITADGRVRFDL